MQELRCEEVLKATGGMLVSGNMDCVFTNVSTDSRKISQGALFVPITGERFDGHDFIKSSLECGAHGVLTQKDISPVPGKVVIKVEDTLRSLGNIAAYYRTKFNIPFVGITGSVGKTSTKDMIAGVLSQKFNVLKTEGNFNNEIGLPLTIFNIDSSHEVGVIEMGMSGFGEISRLTSIVKPHIAVITNIGLSHIEKLGSKNNILKAKMEIFQGLNKNGLVILNGDDKLLYGLKDLLSFRKVYYGMEENLDYQAYNIRSSGEAGTYFEISIKNHDYKVHVPVPGIHNVYNALAAIAAGVELKVPIDMIIKGISEFAPGKMRLNVITHGNFKIINDAYNASPNSMEAAISVLKDIGGTSRTIAVLGDMLEMGNWAEKSHYNVGRFAAQKYVHHVLTVGENSRNIVRGALETGMNEKNVISFSNNHELLIFLKSFIEAGDVILVKGSRGMKMEEIVNGLTEQKI